MAKHSDRRSSIAQPEKTRGPTHRPSVWAGAISICLLLLIIAIRYYGDFLYDYPLNPDHTSLPKDAVIVCLAGGKHRIETAYSLFADGVGERLLIVGAGKKATVMGLARVQGVEVAQKIPWDRFDKIVVETESKNTIENAFVVKRYIEQNPKVKNLILLTSSYHILRAKFMIAHQIPVDINIIPYTPQNELISRKNWWHSWLGIQITTEEYFKYLMANLLIPTLGYF